MSPTALHRNDGDRTFTDVTDAARVAGEVWSGSACFLDYDNDGYLDLYVTNYLQYDPSVECHDADGESDYCGPHKFPGTSDTLYHNNGNGTFTDASIASGIGDTVGKGLGVLCRDFNDDLRVDVFVANDGEPNRLWVNRGDGTFVDEAEPDHTSPATRAASVTSERRRPNVHRCDGRCALGP